MDEPKDQIYRQVSIRIETDWYPYHKNQWFSFHDIIQCFDWREAPARKAVSKKLYYDSTKTTPALEQKNRLYRVINREVKEIDWMHADASDVMALVWPYGVEDQTTFGFEHCLTIPPGSLIVVAGTSNMGKTTWCLNFLIENMDKYPCIYMSSEFSAVNMKRRLRGFDWKSLVNGDGSPKFKAIRRSSDWQDVVSTNPDGINIIDYLSMEDNTLVGFTLKSIYDKLNRGLVVVALQKPPGRDVGYGGVPTLDAASLYLSIDKGLMKVQKAKDWHKNDPNYKKFKFQIVHHGAKFHDIQEIK